MKLGKLFICEKKWYGWFQSKIPNPLRNEAQTAMFPSQEIATKAPHMLSNMAYGWWKKMLHRITGRLFSGY